MPEYAIILIIFLILSVFLHFHYKVKLFKSNSQLLIFYVVILILGIIWDRCAIWRGHWSFGNKFLMGPRLGLMPIEEYAFGIVMPYFGLVIYRVVEKQFG